ncbi:cytochrome c [Paralimibaculum aggregatum]|uniref:Cytochrome c n=1 Tax=Paralimibaculum aggregatum TaxID=3036245 RepID=A0ABQ6LQU5_9RHOB|nr:c-type cytochrome [Limibaculum sp. NKW23]GMG83429.1 cytochrome c [Limibaculum sp. NKW23]
MAIKHMVASVLAAAGLHGPAAAADAPDDLIDRGAYLARIMLCGDCHSPRGPEGEIDETRALGGASIGFEVPGLGVFFPPNLTPDAETGLGSWSDAEILTALRTGERPDGRLLAPIMPWQFFSVLNEADGTALVAYLRSLPSVSHRVPVPTGAGERPLGPYLAVIAPE